MEIGAAQCIAIGILSVGVLVFSTLGAEGYSRHWAVAGAIGSEVGVRKVRSECDALLHGPCIRAQPSSAADGFEFPSGVGVLEVGENQREEEVAVADLANQRVQVMSPEGSFIKMFGRGVSRSHDRIDGSDICEQAADCQAGLEGAPENGALLYPTSIAGASDGTLYVEEASPGDAQVVKLDTDGTFAWSRGWHVNTATGGNFCTANEAEHEHRVCGVGVPTPPDSFVHGGFRFPELDGSLLSVGGPSDLLYAADEDRVQEFTAGGRWVRELRLPPGACTGEIFAVAVDRLGDVFVACRQAGFGGPERDSSDVVYELNQYGRQAHLLQIDAGAGAIVRIQGLAVDSEGELVVIGYELGESLIRRIGDVFSVASGRLLAEFPLTADSDGGIAFGPQGMLYLAAADEQEVLIFMRLEDPALVSSLVPCEPPREGPAAAVYDCRFGGEADAYEEMAQG
jgi:hypothetical protein